MLLRVESLELAYGEVPACRDISFEVAEGEIVTLIGANGAGKTTTLRGVAGAMLPNRGKILFDGAEVTRMPAHRRALAGIALVPEGRRVFPALTVRENLEMGGFKYRKNRKRIETLIDRAMESFPRLRERAAQPAGTLSGGEQQMLALGRALIARPRLLMLDEPSLGLAPIVVREIFEILTRLNEEGLTVLVVEQNANLALAASQHAYVLEVGKVVLSGPSVELREHESVRRSYLGY